MKVLFLNPPFIQRFSRSQRSPAVTKSGTIYYPLWLAYCAGLLEENGFEIKIIDSPADNINKDKTLRLIQDFSPSLLISDTSTPSIYNDIAFTDEIKKCIPDCFVILVGAHVSSLPDESLKLCQRLDAIAKGEYDLTILEIAKTLEANNLNLKTITGISYKNNQEIIHNPQRAPLLDLDRIPMVSKVYKKHLNIRNYFFAASVYPEIQILTARGCPFRCFFCTWPQTFQGKTYRTRSAQNVLEEFIYIKEYLPEVKGLVIEDDTFTVDKNRVKEICELLIKNKVNLKWNANVRTDLDLETMRLMKSAGCYLLITGIESADENILNNIDKGLKSEYLAKFFNNAKQLKLPIHAAFMAGNPGETIETLEMNVRLVEKYLPDTLQFFPLTPYPGTKAYEWAKDNGYLKINSYRDYLTKEGLHNCVISIPGLSCNDLVKWCNKNRNAYYLSLKYILYKLKRAISHPQEFLRTYKALLNFKKHLLIKH